MRVPRSMLISCAVLSIAPISFASERSPWSIDGVIDAGTFAGSGETSWLSGSSGKFRGGSGTNNLIAQAAASIGYDLSLQTGFTVDAMYYSDPSDNAGIVQAFWHIKPLPKGEWRSRYRLGAFHIPISLENRELLWQSKYTISPSMINTWIGEELRTIGAEARWSRKPTRFSKHRISVLAAVFGANDTAGMMLSWRGWAAHDRQTLLGSTIPMAPLPAIEPGAPFANQVPEFEPFVELDNRIGYYAGLDWQHSDGGAIRYLYYDNRGDPIVLKNGQYAWDTRFHHLGVRFPAPAHWTVVGQALFGNTIMGPNAIDNDFMSVSILASRKFENHRVSARLETFEVVDRDYLSVIDPNDESGERMTIGYAFDFNDAWTANVEISRIQSDRSYRAVFGQRINSSDDQLSIIVRHQF